MNDFSIIKSKKQKRSDISNRAEYYDIIINREGNVLIQPFGALVGSFIKKFKVPRQNIKSNIFCG